MAEGVLRAFGFLIIGVVCLGIAVALFILYDGAGPADAVMIVSICLAVLFTGLVFGCLFLAIADGLGHLRAIRDTLNAQVQQQAVTTQTNRFGD